MRKRKTKKNRLGPLFELFRHPLPSFRHRTLARFTIALIGPIWLAGAVSILAPPAEAQEPGRSRAHVFVIFVTVFGDQSFALPEARVRVRRSGEKKFRWEGASDHRGEVAFRVPEGEEYEMTIEARGFKPEIRKIDARQENRADLTIRMEPRTAPRAGGKP